ncbi:SAM-dependent methyltransferase, partial [Pseudomonas sp.]|uniref:SAM-dependent methyltransferase n=1 Tax=Pseudomonas sp. TaxID=306 RepID=UPI002590B23E
MKTILVIGIGAGHPDHLTLQAVKALNRADVDALMALWADDEEIVCVHPNGLRLIGHRPVLGRTVAGTGAA